MYVADEERVALRQVRIGRRYGGDFEILAGLDEGEYVALDPVAAGIYIKERQSAATHP